MPHTRLSHTERRPHRAVDARTMQPVSAAVDDQVERLLRELLALELWRLGAVKINNQKPFKLASGNFSPIYLNCRGLISSVTFIDVFTAAARNLCVSRQLDFDVLAGGETAGIPFAAFLSRAFGKPMIYVRKEAKLHGIRSRIEGVLELNNRVLLVEDLITDAGSKMSFIEAIRAAGARVTDVMVVFDRLQGGREVLHNTGVRLHAISDMDAVLSIGVKTSLISADDVAILRQYIESPMTWHQQHGLPFEPN